MAQKIEFKLLDNAKSVAEHLYNVQVESNCLVFSEFDEKAFELAVALEGLDESVYDVVQNFQTARTLGEYEAAIRHPARFYDPPKYVVKIKLLECLPCLTLSTVSDPRFFAHSNNCKELLVDIAIDEVFGRFMFLLLTEVSDGNSITLCGKMDKAVFIARNICTKNVQHFLTIFCDGQPQTIHLHPVNNVTLERVSFEDDWPS